MYDSFGRISLDNDTIFAQLLLHQNDLLRPFYNKISSRVKWTLGHPGQLSFIFPSQDTLAASEHDRQSPDINIRSPDDAFPSSILDCDMNRRAVRDISQTTFMGCNALVDGIEIRPIRKPNVYIGVL